jgi:uncharacterized protein involved in cysteine biosynthesis
MAKIHSKTIRMAVTLAFFFVALILAFNSIVAKILEKKLNAFLVDKQLHHYHVEYKRVGFNSKKNIPIAEKLFSSEGVTAFTSAGK